MLNPGVPEEYRKVLMEYVYAKESLEFAWCRRNKALSTLIECDPSLFGVVEQALKDDTFYKRLKASVFGTAHTHGLDVSLN